MGCYLGAEVAWWNVYVQVDTGGEAWRTAGGRQRSAQCLQGSGRVGRALNWRLLEHLTSTPTVARDLRKQPSAQRFPVLC